MVTITSFWTSRVTLSAVAPAACAVQSAPTSTSAISLVVIVVLPGDVDRLPCPVRQGGDGEVPGGSLQPQAHPHVLRQLCGAPLLGERAQPAHLALELRVRRA